MGKKCLEREKDSDTKILYKKSYNNINIYSKTPSSQPRPKVSNHKLYKVGGKEKKDLSIETDICILRRYYKNRRNLLLNKSEKTKSPNHSYGDSANGDKLTSDFISILKYVPPNPNIDITNLMLKNFKGLLNKWIINHLIEDKSKIENAKDVFDAVLQDKESTQVQKSSSCISYGDNKAAGKIKRVASTNYYAQCCSSRHPKSYYNLEQSCYTVPAITEHPRIISTLSIPRKVDRLISINKKSIGKVHKHLQKKCLVDPLKILAAVSSYNLLKISTKSLIKRCTNFDDNRLVDMEKSKSRKSTIFSQPSYKSATASAMTIKMKYRDVQKIKEYTHDKRLVMSRSFIKKQDGSPKHKSYQQNIQINSVVTNVTGTITNNKKCHKNTSYSFRTNTNHTYTTTQVQRTGNTAVNTSFDGDNYNKAITKQPTKAPIDHKYAIYQANTEISRKTDRKDLVNDIVPFDLVNQTLARHDKKIPFTPKSSMLYKKLRKQKTNATVQSSSIVRRTATKRTGTKFTYLYKRVTSQTIERSKLMRNMENIVKYIKTRPGGGEVKFQIHVNLGNKENDTNEESFIINNSENENSKPQEIIVNQMTDVTQTTKSLFFGPEKDKMAPVLVYQNNRNIACGISKPRIETKNHTIIITHATTQTESFNIIDPAVKSDSQTRFKSKNDNRKEAFTEHCKETKNYVIRPVTANNKQQQCTCTIKEMELTEKERCNQYKRDRQYKYSTPNDIENDDELPDLNLVRKLKKDSVSNFKERLAKTPNNVYTSVMNNRREISNDTRHKPRLDAKTYKTELPKEKRHDTSKPPHAKLAIGMELKKGISELRTAIKDLAVTTQKLLNEHYNAKKTSPTTTTDTTSDDTKTDNRNSSVFATYNSTEMKKISSVGFSESSDEQSQEVRVVHYVTNTSYDKNRSNKNRNPRNYDYETKYERKAKGNQVVNSLEVTRERQCKKRTAPLFQKSDSYRVIDSESIINVTNMTSKASESKKQLFYSKALTCSLPKLRSLRSRLACKLGF